MPSFRPVLLLVVLAALFPLGATAQVQRSGEPSFFVNSITPYSAPRRPLDLLLTITNGGSVPLQDAAVAVTVYNRVFSRSQLRQSLDGNPQSVLAVTTEQIGEPLGPGERRPLHVTRDLAALTNTFRSGEDSGVYPIAIELRVGDKAVQTTYTAEPFFFEQPPSRLNLVWVLPIHRPAFFDGDGVYQAGSIDREVQKTGFLETFVTALGKHESLPLTIAPTGITLDQMRDLADGFTSRDQSGAVHAVTATQPPAVAAKALLALLAHISSAPNFALASATYARADVVGLVAGGLSPELHRQIDFGASRVQTILGRATSTQLVFPADGRIDARSTAFLSGAGFTTAVLEPETLPERLTRFGYDRPVTVAGGAGASLVALVADSAIRDRLTAQANPVLDVQGAVAETAASYFEQPAIAAERLLVVATPGMPDPAVARGFMDALGVVPWLQLRTAGEAAAALPPTDEPIALQTTPIVERPALSAARVAIGQLGTLGKVLASPDPAPDVLGRLDRFVLAAESADWITQQQRGVDLATAAGDGASGLLSLISVPGRQVTLTSRIAQIPVTVVNGTGHHIHVRIRLDSTKVSFAETPVRDLVIEGRVQTVTFRAETRVTGSFPLSVLVETPDGSTQIGEGTVIVRSTAVSAVTLIATGGGVLVLLATWARRTFRTRKRAASE